MAIDIPLELDSGPITWVKAEIENALFRALEGIRQLRSAPSAEHRNAVRAELHQVSGALELVGIEGLAVLVQEFEKHFGNDVEVVSPEALDLVDRGCRRLLSHLKEMVSGSPPVPLRFISEYLALGKLRRSKFGPADLFFPDLSRRPAKLNNGDAPEPSRMPAFLLRQRRDFQHGLLQWLRGSEAGLAQMRQVISEIEAAYPLPSQRSFWWATHALLEATHTGFVEPSTALKQLMARVDLQVRRFVEGSTRVADRLRREVLYHVARARNGNALVDEVKALYELDVLVPKRVPREIDIVALQPAITHLAAIVARCKDAWASYTSGRTAALQKLRDTAAELPSACDALQMPDFSSLGRGISSAAVSAVENKNVGDDLSIELATSLILIETAIEHIAALPTSFRTQVERAVQRLSYAMSNAPIPTELRAETEANSLTRLAQEKQTISQVAREIRANMRLVEQALDAVFRDRTATDELKPVPALLGQVSGAMRMLGWNEANELLSKTTDRLIESVGHQAALSTQDIDSLADVLAGLSFYVDVRERRERDADAILLGLKRRFLGETGAAADGVDDEDSVEASLADRQRMLRPMTMAFNDAPDRIELRDSLRSTLQGVRQDAELLSDQTLSKASNEALRLLDDDAGQPEALTAAVAAVVGTVAELPPTSAETSRLMESDSEALDTGLLDIFVEEAIEVVQAIRTDHQALLLQRDRRDLLIDVRRAFHTLKGSGRMVGQTQLAEVAWRVEGVLNAALETERSVTEPELSLIGAAAQLFSGWVDTLRDEHRVAIDVGALDGLIAQCSPPAAPVTMTTAPPSPALIPASSQTAPPHATGTAAVPAALAQAATVSAVTPLVPDLAADGADLDAQLSQAVDSLREIWGTEPHTDLPALDDVHDIELAPVIEPSRRLHDHIPLVHPVENFAPDFAATPDADPDSDDMHVLGVSVSRALFSILTDETRVHLQTLDYELALMQFDTSLPPSDPMVRASHTLCGIHRTAGFVEIGDFAGLLESALMSIRRSGRPPAAVSTIASAVRSLRTATLRLQAQSPLSPEEHADLERSRLQLHAILAQTGNNNLGVEIELLEQTHAEERALALPVVEFADTAPGMVPVPTALAVPVVEPTPIPTSDVPASPPPTTRSIEVVAPLTMAVVAAAAVVRAPEQAPAPVSEVATPVLPSIANTITSPEIRPAALPATVSEPVALPPDVSARSPAPERSPAPIAPAVSAFAPVAATAVSASASKAIATPPVFAPAVTPVNLTGPSLAPVHAETVAQSRRADDPLAEIHDDIDDQVLPIFLEEAQELFPRASTQVTAWRQDAHNPVHSDELKRTLHTLKGSARMAGAMRLGELAHSLETHLVDVAGAPSASMFDSFDEYLDDIAFILERLTRNEKDSILPRFAALAAGAEPEQALELADFADDEITYPAAAKITDVVEAPAKVSANTTTSAPAPQRSVADIAQSLAMIRPLPATAAATVSAADTATAFLRVRSDAIEQLADESGEISIHRARIEAEMRGLKGGLLDLTASVVRLRGQLREIEIQGESQIQSRLDQESDFDPLEFDRYTRFQELTRGIAESVNDVATVQQSLLKNLADADTALSSQTRLSRSVQLRLQTLRTVPFSSLSDRLYRVLRQTAKELKKRANLDIRGGRIEIDRSVLERLTPVLEHLVRNALAHGIESDASRKEQGKPDIGELTLNARQQGNEVVISLTDDGGGIPLDRVRSRAIERGMIDANNELTDARLLEFIFQPSFSTAEQITAVAGRGIGMDVVRNEVAALGGRVEVQTSRGVGATFTLSVPLTLAVTQVLMVAVGKAVYGVPSSLIEQVRQLPTKDRTAAMQSGLLDHGGRKIAYRSFGELIRAPHDTGAPHAAPVMVLKAGDVMAAIEVDRILGNQEVVAKPYGPQLARVPGMAGLTVLADGRIALLLNPLNLMLALDSGDTERRQSVSAPAALAPATPAQVPAAVAETVQVAPALPIVEELSVAHVPDGEVNTPSALVEVAAPPEPKLPVFVTEDAPILHVVKVPAPVAAVTAVEAAVVSAPVFVETPVKVPVVAAPPAIAEVPIVVAPPPPAVVAPPPLAPVVTVVAVAPLKAPELAPIFTAPRRVPPVMPEPVAVPYTPTVLVVDDSLTVRKITSRLLEREGYKALTAKDGLDALTILADANPDVILLDIEMPRMDGFEFTKTIKADSRQSHIPIIMITSRTAEKHRSHAMELGVNEYVGKPYQDENLMALVAKYAGKPT